MDHSASRATRDTKSGQQDQIRAEVFCNITIRHKNKLYHFIGLPERDWRNLIYQEFGVDAEIVTDPPPPPPPPQDKEPEKPKPVIDDFDPAKCWLPSRYVPDPYCDAASLPVEVSRHIELLEDLGELDDWLLEEGLPDFGMPTAYRCVRSLRLA